MEATTTPDPKSTRPEAHLGLAHKIAWEFHSQTHEHEDLVQEALLAFVDAARRFDPVKGENFATFAGDCARGHLCRVVAEGFREVAITGRAQHHFFKVLKIARGNPEPNEATLRKIAALLSSTGDVAEHGKGKGLRFSVVDAAQLVATLLRPAKRLNAPIGEHGFTLAEVIPAPGESQEAAVLYRELHTILDAYRRTLADPRAVRVLDRYLADDDTTMEALGRRFGVTRARMQQIEAQVLDGFVRFARAYKPLR